MEEVQERRQEYVTLEMHNFQLERIELLMERNLAKQEAMASEMKAEFGILKGEVRALDAKVDGLEKKVDARIDGLEDSIAVTNMRIDDLKSSQSNKIALWAIAAAIGICAFQTIVSLILFFLNKGGV